MVLQKLPANSSILFLGNSHTRQVVQTFLCQYRHEIVREEKKANSLYRGDEGNFVAHLKGNITVYSSTNSPLHFLSDDEWRNAFKLVLGKDPFDIDFIIFGRFNTQTVDKNTNFFRLMDKFFQGRFASMTQVLSLRNLAGYHGRVISLGMFAAYDYVHHDAELNAYVKRIPRDPPDVQVVKPRLFAEEVGRACGASHARNTGACVDDRNQHTCMNPGYPDLAVYELMSICLHGHGAYNNSPSYCREEGPAFQSKNSTK